MLNRNTPNEQLFHSGSQKTSSLEERTWHIFLCAQEIVFKQLQPMA